MGKLLALAGILALLGACAHPTQSAATAEQVDEGTEIAASLGYHVPATRAALKKGN
jgi:hypothetical protein